MKYLNYISTIAILFLALVSCKNEDLAEFTNRAYIAQTETKANTAKVLSAAVNEAAPLELNVRLSQPLDKDATFTFKVKKEVLDAYNKRNGKAYEMLTENLLKMTEQKVTVKKGKVLSNTFKAEVLLTDEALQSGKKFSIPFAIEVESGGVCPVVGGDELVYIIQPVVVTQVPVLGIDKLNGVANNYIKATASVTKMPLAQWTLEFNVNMSAYSKNNQQLFHTHTSNSQIFVRFGDTGQKDDNDEEYYNYLNPKFGTLGGQIKVSKSRFTPNEWYHIALAYDGSMLYMYVNGELDTAYDGAKAATFELGDAVEVINASILDSDGKQYIKDAVMMSELRIWNVARTQAEIRENAWAVDAKSEGLLHYWKMNEGQGDTFKNSVENAPDMKTNVVPRWIEGVRSDGKGTNDSGN